MREEVLSKLIEKTAKLAGVEPSTLSEISILNCSQLVATKEKDRR